MSVKRRTPPTRWRTDARQARSRRTEAALAAAAQRLLTEQPFDNITVSDLTRRAGVAVGTFYRRFRDKRAVLHLADMGFIDDTLAAFDATMSDRHMKGKPLEAIVSAYVTLMIAKFREHKTAILQVQRNADPNDRAEYARRAKAFNDHVHGRFRALLRRHASTITHPDLELALNLAIFFASAAARDAVWRDSLRAYPISIDDRGLMEQIVRAFLAYLRS